MKIERIPWHLLLGLILGLGLGLLISWVIAPTEYTDTSPALLRSDFKDGYRALIASAYASTDNLDRAKDRLTTLNDPNPIAALESQAQRSLAEGKTSASLDALALLAADLAYENTEVIATATSTHFPTRTPHQSVGTAQNTATEDDSTPEPELPTLTPVPIYTRTQAPTKAASPTPGAPYILQTQDEICSTNISEGLIMVYVSNASQKGVSGVEIIVSWDGNEEYFFTGLKPELGDGYADFAMETNQNYSIRLAMGSTAASNLSAPPCQDEDEITIGVAYALDFSNLRNSLD